MEVGLSSIMGYVAGFCMDRRGKEAASLKGPFSVLWVAGSDEISLHAILLQVLVLWTNETIGIELSEMVVWDE